MILPWLKFAVCAAIIVLSGRSVAKYGDVIAWRTGLGRVWIGTILVAMSTSLPELFTGISSVALVRVPDLTIGNLFGANAFNLLNLALLDIASRHQPLFGMASTGHLLVAGFSLILVSFAAAGILLKDSFLGYSLGWIGLSAPIIVLIYLVAARGLFNFERRRRAPLDAEVMPRYEAIPLRRAYLYFSIAAAFVIGAGTWLAFVGRDIAQATGWAESFVGSLFLAFSTTLPEITVSFFALRLGAYDICVGNMLGSNLFNMSIIAVDDLFYRPGPVLSSVSTSHVFTALLVILMTGIVIAGLMARPQHKPALRATWYSLALIVVFLIGYYLNFSLG
ncbi:MAG TPA: sodium:calcium antiporter [Dehalococcoidia bacterium]|nr:sodium:calcium antiporter [Dehalococcoidia bacterium]